MGDRLFKLLLKGRPRERGGLVENRTQGLYWKVVLALKLRQDQILWKSDVNKYQ